VRVATAFGAVALAALAGCGGGHRADIRYRVAGHEQAAIPGPPGAPLLVLLHSHGADPGGFISNELVAALRRLGPRAASVVIPDGGRDGYWHDRRSGRWGTYVVQRVIPAAVRRLHADPQRVAIGGISMGGFGALDAARNEPHRFCAVGGHSAALWRTGAETPQGAFDDAEDFARNDVLHLPFRYRGPLWIDVGKDDPFRSADVEFARTHGARLHVWPGGHHWSYWNAHWDDYLRFYVSSCR